MSDVFQWQAGMVFGICSGGFLLLSLLIWSGFWGVKRRLAEVAFQLGEVASELRLIALRLETCAQHPGPMQSPESHDNKDDALGVIVAQEIPQPRWSEPLARQKEGVRPNAPPNAPYEMPIPSPTRLRDLEDVGALKDILQPTEFEPTPLTRSDDVQRREAFSASDAGHIPSDDPDEIWRLKPSKDVIEDRMTPARRRNDGLDLRRARSEPTLRWPPRGRDAGS